MKYLSLMQILTAILKSIGIILISVGGIPITRPKLNLPCVLSYIAARTFLSCNQGIRAK